MDGQSVWIDRVENEHVASALSKALICTMDDEIARTTLGGYLGGWNQNADVQPFRRTASR
jgi:hypothetical protein